MRQQNSNLPEENDTKNKIFKILTENLSTANKNIYYVNVEPEEIHEKFYQKSKTKTNEKSMAERRDDNRYEMLYLADSDDSDSIADSGTTYSKWYFTRQVRKYESKKKSK